MFCGAPPHAPQPLLQKGLTGKPGANFVENGRKSVIIKNSGAQPLFSVMAEVLKRRRSPDIPRERNGGVCKALAGNNSPEVIHITSVLAILGAVGALASIVSLVLYWYDRKKK